MDLAKALEYVKTLDPERKQYLLAAHEAGSLTQAEKEELADHLSKASLDQKYSVAIEQFLK